LAYEEHGWVEEVLETIERRAGSSSFKEEGEPASSATPGFSRELVMVVAMRGLTSLSPLGTTPAGLEARQGASLALPSAGEPLNPTTSVKASLSPVGIGEGKSNPGFRPGEPNRLRVPVVDARGVPLMPCTPARARLLLKKSKAVAKWNKLGMLYLRLKYAVEPKNQMLAVGVDPGSKYEALSVVGTKDTVLNVMSEAVDWVKKALEARRQMRRVRRYRKTRYRKWRRDNRHPEGRFPPSTKARWDAKLRIIAQLKKNIPISHAVVEDVEAVTKKDRRWNTNFSPIEVGKQYFYSMLKAMGLEVITKSGNETKAFRDSLGLKKIKNKSKPVFESQCVDSWCLAAMVTGAENPTAKSLYYIVPLRWHRRQLHYLEPSKGGVRRRYGGTISLGLKKGTLVKHVKYGLCYIGGNLRGRFNLHSLKTGERLTQNAKRIDFKILTRIAFRVCFSPAKAGAFFG
jgi:hypothetical protein